MPERKFLYDPETGEGEWFDQRNIPIGWTTSPPELEPEPQAEYEMPESGDLESGKEPEWEGDIEPEPAPEITTADIALESSKDGVLEVAKAKVRPTKKKRKSRISPRKE